MQSFDWCRSAIVRPLPLSLLAILAIGFVASRGASAQTLVGVRGGAYLDEGDPFVGGEVLVGLGNEWFFNPNVEAVFADRATKVPINFDLHYDFAHRDNATFWIGGGLAGIYVNPEGTASSHTDVGANVLFGVGFRTRHRWIPYVQGKLVAADDSDFALAFGIRF